MLNKINSLVIGGLGLVFMRFMLWAIVACLCWSGSARADITYQAFTVESGVFVLISGEFEPYDDPGDLVIEIAASNATAVSFNSRGGNVDKAMACGKVIRALELPTFQTNKQECSSACVYAFMGGVERIAGDGALGVHRSTVKQSEIPDAASAVAAVQEMTARIIAYLEEMGVDPGLMKVVLSVAHDEMRALTATEMEKYRVVTRTAKAS